MCLQHLVVGQEGFQLCRGGCTVQVWVGVVISGIGACVVIGLEQWIADILVGVGSSDEYSSREESDHQDGADELRKTGSGGIYGRHAENV